MIVTKFGIGYPDKPRMRDSSPEQIAKSIESSLTALGSDYVDVYLVHWPDVNTPFEETMRAREDLKKIAARHDKSVVQLALRWATTNPTVSVALTGCRNPAEVEENAAAFEFTPSEADLAEIDQMFEKHGIETAPDTWIEDDEDP